MSRLRSARENVEAQGHIQLQLEIRRINIMLKYMILNKKFDFLF